MASFPKITRVAATRSPGRFYKVEGFKDPFPSVTTVLDVINRPHLQNWAKTQALQAVRSSILASSGGISSIGDDQTPEEWIDSIIKDADANPSQTKAIAADFGTQTHTIIEQLLNGENPKIPERFIHIVKNFRSFQKQSGFAIKEVEKMVFSAKHQYAGALDAIATYEENGKCKLIAVDWKTSNALYSGTHTHTHFSLFSSS